MTNFLRSKFMLFAIILLCLCIVGYILLLSFSSRSSSVEQQVDVIFNSQPSCKPPCWKGLIPNKTTEEEFLKFIDLEQSERSFQLIKDENPHVIYYAWEDPESNMGIQVSIDNTNTVNEISFNVDITLEDLLNELGSPDTLTAAAPFDMGFYAELLFFYEEAGVIGHSLFSELPEGEHPWTTCMLNVTNDLPIRWIHFVDSSNTKEMREIINYYNSKELIQPWVGLGSVVLDPCANIDVP